MSEPKAKKYPNNPFSSVLSVAKKVKAQQRVFCFRGNARIYRYDIGSLPQNKYQSRSTDGNNFIADFYKEQSEIHFAVKKLIYQRHPDESD